MGADIGPKYLVALGGVADSTGKAPLLGAIASPANVAIATAKLPGYKLPYASISATNTKATIAQTLLAFPQYSGVSDTWGNVGNISYNSLQASLSQRPWHGLSYTVNYTWSKNMGDEGTYRSGYDLPPGSVSGSSQTYKQNRIDVPSRSPTRPKALRRTVFGSCPSAKVISVAIGFWYVPWRVDGRSPASTALRAAFRWSSPTAVVHRPTQAPARSI
jgi:hypothetical protein